MIDDSYYKRLRQIESKGNYNARNASGAWGGYQFMPQTAKQYGLPYGSARRRNKTRRRRN